jgi:hypothetical protein
MEPYETYELYEPYEPYEPYEALMKPYAALGLAAALRAA